MNRLPAFVLRVCSIFYAIAIFFWDLYWRIAPKVKPPVKIISVGNLVAGGAGKTPLTIYIARLAIERGIKTSIVARGYRRKGKGLLEVNERSRWEEVGDEPLEIAAAVPQARIYVCESKTRAALKACADGAELIIIDDGYQHRRLQRDLNILCLRSEKPFGNGLLLPAGRLREPKAAVKRADMIVFTGGGQVGSDEERPDFPNIPVFYLQSVRTHFRELSSGREIDIEELAGKRFVAFCGLADPTRFRRSLIELGITLTDFIAFDDHHSYSSCDIDGIVRTAQESGSSIMTTAKDAVKVKDFDFVRSAVYICLPEYEIDDLDHFRKVIAL